MRTDADPALFAIWARGWTLTRGVRPPDPVPGGWRIEAGRPDGHWRFLYPALCDDIAERARTALPESFAIKVAASADRVAPLLPDGWHLDGTTCMMTASPTVQPALIAPQGYSMTCERPFPSVSRVVLLTLAGDIAASGQIAVVEDVAIFDQIRTRDGHQRRGLGRYVMRVLGDAASEGGAKRWILAATAQGRALYETLGWEVHSPYTTASLISV